MNIWKGKTETVTCHRLHIVLALLNSNLKLINRHILGAIIPLCFWQSYKLFKIKITQIDVVGEENNFICNIDVEGNLWNVYNLSVSEFHERINEALNNSGNYKTKTIQSSLKSFLP